VLFTLSRVLHPWSQPSIGGQLLRCGKVRVPRREVPISCQGQRATVLRPGPVTAAAGSRSSLLAVAQRPVVATLMAKRTANDCLNVKKCFITYLLVVVCSASAELMLVSRHQNA
jgi:hypothetical protein